MAAALVLLGAVGYVLFVHQRAANGPTSHQKQQTGYLSEPRTVE
jgi:hypothetical protein